MNLYGHDHSFLGLSFSDLFAETVARNSPDLMLESASSTSAAAQTPNDVRSSSPPRHRHDGSSPLPLGMDWSPAPRKLDGRGCVWPHDPRTGWSYCVTVPSYSILPSSKGSAPIVFYRVKVGIQSPKAITTIHGILRRFSDFVKLFSELKNLFPEKFLPPNPPRKLMRNKSRIFLDERRCALEDWLEKLLSDIDISRSAVVANFLELEVAARSSFHDTSSRGVASAYQYASSLDISLHAGSSVASEYGDDTYDISDIGTPRHETNSVFALSRGNSVPEIDVTGTLESLNTNFSKNNSLSMRELLDTIQKLSRDQMLSRGGSTTRGKDKAYEGSSTAVGCDEDGKDVISEVESNKVATHVRRLSTESAGSESSSKATETSTLGATSTNVDSLINIHEGSESPRAMDINSTLLLPSDLVVALPLEARRKFNRVLSTMERRLATAKTDMEDLVARLNQELAVRQYLSTKVKDLEVELETTKENIKENLQQAVSSEKERFNQMQWDIEELRKSCLELELKLKTEQDEKALIESSKASIIKENETLLLELDAAREQFDNLQKHHEQSELKSKTDVKVLVKEVKSLRTSQSELKQELSRLMKEKFDIERILQKEKQRMDQASSANAKLLHECEILRNRLQECSVNFLVEEEDKFIMDASTPSDAIDLLVTSDNRIGLLLAEAQLLAQDVENARLAESSSGDRTGKTDDELRKMLTDIFIDNARLRKQMNSVIRCALNTQEKPENDVKEDDGAFRITVLSKFLER